MGRDVKQKRLSGPRVSGAVVGALLLAGLGLTACSSSSGPQVASLGATTTTAAAAGASVDGIPDIQQTYQDELNYAQCMRSHGVPGFPDPPQPTHSIGNDLDADSGAPHFKTASDTCKHLLPDDGGPPTAGQRQAMMAALLKYSVCMRKHGEPNFPDPVDTGGGVGIELGPSSGTNSTSSQFAKAQSACKSLLPGGGP